MEQFYEDLQDLLELPTKNDALFIIGDWNANVGTHRVTGKLDLRVQNEAGQRLTEFCRRTYSSEQTLSANNTRDNSIHRCHRTVNTEIRLIILFAAEYEETRHSQQKQNLGMTVTQITSSLLQIQT